VIRIITQSDFYSLRVGLYRL